MYSIILLGLLSIVYAQTDYDSRNLMMKSARMRKFEVETMANVKIPRSDCSAQSNGEYIFLFGGCISYELETSYCTTLSDSIERYDAKNDVWEELDVKIPVPIYRHSTAIDLEHNIIYILGGLTDTYDSDDTINKIVYAFDLEKLTFVSQGSFPDAKSDGGAAFNAKTNTVLFVGGYEIPSYDISNGIYEYDPKTKTTTKLKQTLNSSRGDVAITVRPRVNRAIVYGGYTLNEQGEFVATPTSEVIQMNKNSNGNGFVRMRKKHTVTPRGEAAIGVIGRDLFVLGGENDLFESVSGIECFMRQSVNQLPKNVFRGAYATHKKGIYVIGGQIKGDNSSPLSSTYKFSFIRRCPYTLNPAKCEKYGCVIRTRNYENAICLPTDHQYTTCYSTFSEAKCQQSNNKCGLSTSYTSCLPKLPVA